MNAGTQRQAGIRTATRMQMWWSPKLLPVFGAATLAALTAAARPTDTLVRLAAMAVSAIGLAAASHLINDWADIDADAAAEKPNAVAVLPIPMRWKLVGISYAIGLLPWLFVPIGTATLVVLGFLLVLPVLYSVPPIRLKRRAFLGVIADALNAHVAPTAFAFTLVLQAGTMTGDWELAFGGAAAWACGFGIRGILAHQMADRSNDLAAGVETFVLRYGRYYTVRVGWLAFGIELAGLGAMLLAIWRVAPWATTALLCYLGVWLLERRWEPRPFQPVPDPGNSWMPLAEFYEVWPVVLFTAALCASDYRWWPLPVAIVVGFGAAIVKQARDLASLLRNLLYDLRRATVWLWWRIHNAATWIWWHPINWLWWHPLGWVRFQVLRRARWFLQNTFVDVMRAASRRRRQLCRRLSR